MKTPEQIADMLLTGACSIHHDKHVMMRDCRSCVAETFRVAQRNALIELHKRMSVRCNRCGEVVHEQKTAIRNLIDLIDGKKEIK